MDFRTGYNYDVDAVSHATGLCCTDPSLTVQSEKDDADINVIVRRFGITGQLPADVRMPVSGDFTGIGDYHTALNQVLAAQQSFMEFPADIRRRFNDDPGNLIAFVEDPANREEAVRLGLVVPPVAAPSAGAGAASTATTASPSPSA